MDFSLVILAEKTRIQISLQGQNSKKSTVRCGCKRNLEPQKDNMITKNAHSGMKRFVSGI